MIFMGSVPHRGTGSTTQLSIKSGTRDSASTHRASSKCSHTSDTEDERPPTHGGSEAGLSDAEAEGCQDSRSGEGNL